jgi:hypothetical protein
MATQSSSRPANLTWLHWRRGVFAAAWLCAACGVSPKPEPPITVPKPPTLDDSLVSCRAPDPGDAAEGVVLIVGTAGAVDPEEGVVRAVNLDDTSPAVEAAVSNDGSFELELSAEQGNQVRLEVLGLEAASGPRDLTLRKLGVALERVEPPLGDCLELDLGGLMWLKSKGQGELRVVDSCGLGIELAEPRPRSNRDQLQLGADLTWPLTLEKNEPIGVQVEATGGTPGDEYLFFVEATAPQADRRAVSVRLE